MLIKVSRFAGRILFITFLLVGLGLNWGGVQLGVWAASTLDKIDKMTFKEAFKHALSGSEKSLNERLCLCVPCQLVDFKHLDRKGQKKYINSFSFILEGISKCSDVRLFYDPMQGFLLDDRFSELVRIKAPPLLEPPQPSA